MPPKRTPNAHPTPRHRANKKSKAKKEISTAEAVTQEPLQPLTSLTLLVQGSNLVTFGAGLQVTRAIPGSELCKLFIRDLPSNATEDEIADTILVPSGVDPTAFKILSCKREHKAKVAQVLLRIEEANALLARYTLAEGGAAHIDSAFRPTSDLPIELKFEIQPFHRAQGAMVVPHFADSLTLAVLWYTKPPPASGTTTRRGASAAFDPAGFIEQLKEGMELDGCVDGSFKAAPMTSASGMKVTAKFKSRQALEIAAKRVGGPRRAPQQKGPPGPKLHVMVPTEFHFSIYLPVERYEAQEALWAAEVKKAGPGGQDAEAVVRISGQNMKDRERVVVNLKGSSEEKVGALKVRLERLSAGERLGAEMWHDALMDPGILEALSVEVKTMAGVIMSVDSRVNILRLFGAGGSLDLAKVIIRNRVNALRREKGNSVDEGAGVGRGARSSTGEGSGNRSDLRCFRCLGRTGDAVVLECHSFCAKCFGEALGSPALLQGTFPILCSAAQGAVPFGTLPCANTTPIPLHIIRDLLPAPRFNRLVDAAFVHYVQSNPHRYKACPTPLCREIHQRAERGEPTLEARQCPSCFVKICPVFDEETREEKHRQPRTSVSLGPRDRVKAKSATLTKNAIHQHKVRGRSTKEGQREYEDFVLQGIN